MWIFVCIHVCYMHIWMDVGLISLSWFLNYLNWDMIQVTIFCCWWWCIWHVQFFYHQGSSWGSNSRKREGNVNQVAATRAVGCSQRETEAGLFEETTGETHIWKIEMLQNGACAHTVDSWQYAWPISNSQYVILYNLINPARKFS